MKHMDDLNRQPKISKLGDCFAYNIHNWNGFVCHYFAFSAFDRV